MRSGSLGERLVWARKRVGLTQEQLSEQSGVKQGTISKIERGDQARSTFTTTLAHALGVSPTWLAEGTGTPHIVHEASAPYGVNDAHKSRRVMIIDDVQAGGWRDCIDAYEVGDGFDELLLEPEKASRYSARAFGLRITGVSMSPMLEPGDRVVVDPEEPIRPGDIVVAKVKAEEQATIKKYRARGYDERRQQVFELVPFNDDYATVRVDSDNPCELIGPVVEYRRSFR